MPPVCNSCGQTYKLNHRHNPKGMKKKECMDCYIDRIIDGYLKEKK